MIVIVGESGSGKSTLQDYIIEKTNNRYKKVISYTTRPKRSNEVDDIDYHFVDEEEFEKRDRANAFVETSVYNNWHYGLCFGDLTDDSIAILTPHGLREVKKYIDSFHLLIIYLSVDRGSRLAKLVTTREDVDECIRRNISDCGMFDGIRDEVNVVLDNRGYRFDTEHLYKKLEGDIKQYEELCEINKISEDW